MNLVSIMFLEKTDREPLLITRKIITEHGGRVEIESEKGEGSTFRLELPRDRLPKIVDSVE